LRWFGACPRCIGGEPHRLSYSSLRANHQQALMKQLSKIYQGLIERHSFAIFCVFAAVLGLVVPGAMLAVRSNTNDVKDWLPDAYQETTDLLWYQQHFGAGSDHAVVLTWPGARLTQGDDEQPNWRDMANPQWQEQRAAQWEEYVRLYREVLPEDPAQLELRRQLFMAAPLADQRLDLLARKVLEKPELFKGVITGPLLLTQLTGPPLNLPAEEAMSRLQGTVFGPQFLHGLRLRASGDSGRPVIDEVEIETAAAAAGVREGEVIESINGVPTPTLTDAVRQLAQTYRVDQGEMVIQVAGRSEPYRWEWNEPFLERLTCVVIPLADRELREAYWERQAKQRRLKTKKELINTVNELQRIAVEECDIPADQLHMGGPPVDNMAIDREGEESLRRLAMLSFGVGFLFCMFCLRNLKLTLIVFFTSIFSELTSLAIVWYSGAKVDAILLTMPSLIYVLTVSGAIHIVNYYRDAVAEEGLAGAPARAIAKAVVPCTLANLTTAVGLASLYISDLVPIRKFGVFSAIAVMVALVWLFVLLPAALQIFPLKQSEADALRQAAMRPPRRAAWHRWLGSGGRFVINRGGLVFTLMLLGTVVLGYGAVTQMKTTVKLMKLFDPNARIIRDYAWIESKLADLVPMEVVIHTSNQALVTVQGQPTGGTFQLAFEDTATDAAGLPIQRQTEPLPYNATGRQLERALHRAGFKEATVVTTGQSPNVVHRISADRPLPWFDLVANVSGGEVQLENRPPMIDNVRLLNRIRQSLESLEHINTTLSIATFTPREVEAPANYLVDEEVDFQLRKAVQQFTRGGYLAYDPHSGEELYRISLRMGAFDDIDYSIFVSEIKKAVDPIVMLEPLTGKQGWQAAPLPDKANVATDYHYQHPDGSVAVVHDDNGQCTVTVDGKQVFAGRRQALATAATYTGVVPLVYKAQNELLRGLLESYVLAFVLIGLVMVALTWTMVGAVLCVPAALLLMLPNTFPTAVVFGTMTWSGMLIDIGTMMTASVALGVAVDDTLHYITWFHRGVRRGLTRRQAAWEAYGHCAAAMTQTTLIAGVAMFVFAASSFTPTAMFGILMVPLMVTALIGDLLMLPAILTSWVGRIFGSSNGSKLAASDVEPSGSSIEGPHRPHALENAPHDRRLRADRRTPHA
jgi:predicted RND superfamily exporter protein